MTGAGLFSPFGMYQFGSGELLWFKRVGGPPPILFEVREGSFFTHYLMASSQVYVILVHVSLLATVVQASTQPHLIVSVPLLKPFPLPAVWGRQKSAALLLWQWWCFTHIWNNLYLRSTILLTCQRSTCLKRCPLVVSEDKVSLITPARYLFKWLLAGVFLFFLKIVESLECKLLCELLFAEKWFMNILEIWLGTTCYSVKYFS